MTSTYNRVTQLVARKVANENINDYNSNNNYAKYVNNFHRYNHITRYENNQAANPRVEFDRLYRLLKRERDDNLIRVITRSMFNVLNRFEWRNTRAWGRSYTKLIDLLKSMRNHNRRGINLMAVAQGAANNAAMANYLATRMNNSASNFNRNTVWGRRANKNTAKAWYNQETGRIKTMNRNVIHNIIGLNKFRPGPFNGNTKLYFDANDPKRHLFTKNGMVGSRGINPYYAKNTPMRPYMLPLAVNQALFRFMSTREHNARGAANKNRNANNIYNNNN